MLIVKESKKFEVVDFYEYVCNMGKGVFMELICLKIVFNFKFIGYLDLLILWKNF